MVINEKFVWAHLPKTGGTTTLSMFNNLDIELLMDDKTDPSKHQTYSVRDSIYALNKTSNNVLEKIEGKDRILGFRRLPNFLLSFYYHRKNFNNLDLDLNNIKKCVIDNSTCDKLLLGYEPEKVKHWIRVENITEDFISAIGNYTTKIPTESLNNIVDNSNTYNKDVFSHFTKSEITSMYDLSPVWTSIEKRLYGNLII